MTRLRIEPGQRFGRLVVQSKASPPSVIRWNTLCDCGGTKVVTAGNLRAENVRSCGCLHSQSVAARNTTHGHFGTLVYGTWVSMNQRCTDASCSAFKNYGGRGITVCERWKSFENFLADMGERPSGTTLDRIDNSGNYEPGNCRWATNRQQATNKRSTRLVVIDGVSKSVTEWCEEFGTSRTRAFNRIRSGWQPEDAVRKTDQ